MDVLGVVGFTRKPLFLSVSQLFFPVCGFFFFHAATFIESLPVFMGWGRVVFGGGFEGGASDTKSGSSCLYSLLLPFLLPVPVMSAVTGLLLLLELFQVFGLKGAQQRVSKLPVVLAVLINQAHLWLAQDGQQVLVLACAGGPLCAAGVERRCHQTCTALHQCTVDSPAWQHHQLQLDQRVFEILFCGRALVQARVRGLQRSHEQTLFCLQNPTVWAHLQRKGCSPLAKVVQ